MPRFVILPQPPFEAGTSICPVCSPCLTGRKFCLNSETSQGQNLKRLSGILGTTTMTGGTRDIIQHVRSIFKEFCTPGKHRPLSERERKRKLTCTGLTHEPLFKKICQKVHMWNGDAASDCQLAGHILHSKAQSVTDQGRTTFPNLRLVNWDTTHGSRRLTSRPWKTDRYIDESLRLLLFEKKSIVRLIQHSQEFKQMLKANVDKMPGRVGTTVQNLSYAGHRFDSTTKPLGRAVHQIYPLVSSSVKHRCRGAVLSL